jgi:hypothetical protein
MSENIKRFLTGYTWDYGCEARGYKLVIEKTRKLIKNISTEQTNYRKKIATLKHTFSFKN